MIISYSPKKFDLLKHINEPHQCAIIHLNMCFLFHSDEQRRETTIFKDIEAFLMVYLFAQNFKFNSICKMKTMRTYHFYSVVSVHKNVKFIYKVTPILSLYSRLFISTSILVIPHVNSVNVVVHIHT